MINVHWNSPHLSTSQMPLMNHKLNPENKADPIRLQEGSKNYAGIHVLGTKKYWCSLQAPQTRLSKKYSRYWAVGSLWELDYCSHEKGNFNFNVIINLQCNALASWKCQEWTQAEQYTVPCCFSNIREKDWLSTSVYGNLTKFFVCCPHRTSTTLAIHTTDNKTKKNKTLYNIFNI